MPLRTLAKRLVAGLVVVSLMFQAALFAAQISILIAARADAALSGGVICADHGLAETPLDEADRPSACKFCPLCLTPGAGQIAILLGADFSLLEVSAKNIGFYFNSDRGTHERSAQPRSRGPPAFA